MTKTIKLPQIMKRRRNSVAKLKWVQGANHIQETQEKDTETALRNHDEA